MLRSELETVTPFTATPVATGKEQFDRNSKIRVKIVNVGIDVIGNYLTEINVTSPTCIQEIKKLHKIDVAKIIFDKLDE